MIHPQAQRPQGYPMGSPQVQRTGLPPQISPQTFNHPGGMRQSPQQVPGVMRQSPQQGAVPQRFQPSPTTRNISMAQPHPGQVSQVQSVVPSQFQQVERIEQPLQVVDLHQVEEPWRKRVQELEKQLAQYQGKPQPVPQQVYVQHNNNDGKLDEMDQELSQAYSQIQQLINTIKILQDENENHKQNLENKQRYIDELEDRLREKQGELDDANNTIDDLQAQLDEVSLQQNEKHTYLIEEVNTWKQKFIELNREFHTNQEQLMLAQAELDNLKNGGVVVTKTSEYTSKKTSK